MELEEKMRPPSKIRKSIEKLRDELEYLRERQNLLQEEAKYREALEKMHPSKKRQAIRALGKVLGGVQKEIRGTPEQRIARRKKLKKALRKFKSELEKEERRRASGRGFFE